MAERYYTGATQERNGEREIVVSHPSPKKGEGWGNYKHQVALGSVLWRIQGADAGRWFGRNSFAWAWFAQASFAQASRGWSLRG